MNGYNKKVDIFALGCLLHELINGERFPLYSDKFRAKIQECEKMMKFKLNLKYESLNCSFELKNLVNKMLNENELERPTIDDILIDDFVFEHFCEFVDTRLSLHNENTEWNRTWKDQLNKIQVCKF